MQLTSYLFFRDQAKAAFELYAKCLDGKIVSEVTYGEMPDCPNMPDNARDRIANICLKVGESLLMGSDCPPDSPFNAMQGCAVSIHAGTVSQAENVFAALGEGGRVTMPLGETFWAQRFGMLTDRFGIQWMVNCDR